MQPGLGLQVNLAVRMPTIQAESISTIPIEVSVHNAASVPISLLKWGSPLDNRAEVLGIFEVFDLDDEKNLPMETVKIARKLPASVDDLLEICAGQTLRKLVNLQGLHLKEGHQYSIQAKGIWHAIWEEHLENVTVSQLQNLIGAQRREFRTNVVNQVGMEYTHSPKEDALRVFRVLLNGGIAIIPVSVGYGIVATTGEALDRIFVAKQREPRKRHAMIGNFTLHQELHDLSGDAADIVRFIVKDMNLPIGVVAPYRSEHAIIRKLHPSILNRSSLNGTMAMLLNGGPFQEELSRLATDAELPLLGSSANLSGKGTKVTVEDIEPEVKDVADIVVDYGRSRYCDPRPSSTMIDFQNMEVLRFGACYDDIRDSLLRNYGIDLPNDPGRENCFPDKYQDRTNDRT
ncbi:hypothetical protein N7462_005278 [Penicillium macrosclerotiorum]|uniref:uncharacterized protein n=1 Tax=Penicillium macrosclerotiorum TaxID=303699 RepID=UPI002546FC81|nr:uncharacterized protein N7462_005278 [Penicillium macrosclerotiorum]KAJ5690886.1 hypothetical protein N7462_005278 [Penicillium macrosclerotiorum]